MAAIAQTGRCGPRAAGRYGRRGTGRPIGRRAARPRRARGPAGGPVPPGAAPGRRAVPDGAPPAAARRPGRQRPPRRGPGALPSARLNGAWLTPWGEGVRRWRVPTEWVMAFRIELEL